MIERTQALAVWLATGGPLILARDLVRARPAGQGLAEYALILALIAVIAIVALIFLGGQTSKILSTVGRSV